MQKRKGTVCGVLLDAKETADVITCTLWKFGSCCYRITVSDIRYRYLDTACITDVDTLFSSMEDIAKELHEKAHANTTFNLLNTRHKGGVI